MPTYTPARGGRAPGHLRAMMDAYLDDGIVCTDVLFSEPPGDPITWLTGQLWNCTDIVPSAGGQTYGQASRRARAALRP